ncbi:glycosyltransferase [Bacillus inaquosorum]|nr:glycosyltransferase [Bacillus inaquosorum]
MKQPQPVLTIVVPCFNEEEVFQETSRQLTEVVDGLIEEKLIAEDSKILFVDDGKERQNLGLDCHGKHKKQEDYRLKISLQCRTPKALLAGLHKAKNRSDCVISIDADLQDDISVIRDFILKYHEGREIVYGVRRKRKPIPFSSARPL